VTDSVQNIEENLKNLVKARIGSFAVPQKILFVPGVPKTRSGKIMRRVLRKVAHGDTDFGDLSTLANPEIVQLLVK
jgi:acetyl-CoA synthetase